MRVRVRGTRARAGAGRGRGGRVRAKTFERWVNSLLLFFRLSSPLEDFQLQFA
jgi:hypothetical protein